MKITLISTGKSDDGWVRDAVKRYADRIPHYTAFQHIETDDVKAKTKKPDPAALLRMEAQKQMKHIAPSDFVVIFDEHGKSVTSEGFADFFAKHHLAGTRHMVFIIGGAHGFDQEVKARANASLSLSKMTLTHQMVRILALEQIYRAHTILKGEPYHHS